MIISELTPKIADDIKNDALDYYNLVLRPLGETTHEAYQQAEKHVVEKRGMNWEAYKEWCAEYLYTDEDEMW